MRVRGSKPVTTSNSPIVTFPNPSVAEYTFISISLKPIRVNSGGSILILDILSAFFLTIIIRFGLLHKFYCSKKIIYLA